MRIPFDEAGGRCVFSSEWDKYATITYHANFNEQPHGDITKIAAEAIPPHDLLLAGFPCQPFSRAGLCKGFTDKRGMLFFEIMRIVRYHEPKVLLLENVKGLRSHDNGQTFSIIKCSLKKSGYTVYDTVLNARDFGLPQSRERIYIVAVNNKKLSGRRFVFPTPPYTATIVDAILEKRVQARYTISNRCWKRLQKRKLINAQKGNGFGYRLFKRSSPYTNTIVASYYKGRGDTLIWQRRKNPRKLTPREIACLQGFSKQFIIPVSDTQAYKQFGNAVAVPVIRAIASEVIRLFK